MRVYSSPTQTRDSPVRSSWTGITLLPWPRLRPIPHKPVSIPRAVCEWYKPDRRRSGRGSELPGVLSCSEPTGGAPCIALCRVCAAEAATWQWWAVAAVGVAVTSTWPCVWGVPLSRQHVRGDGTLGAEGQSQVEEEHLHAMLPSHSPIMRQQVAPGSSLKSLSRGSCWASRVRESLCHHLLPVARGLTFLGLRPLPASPCVCAVPQEPCSPLPQRRFLS